TAAFRAEPLTGNAPFTVHFFDTSGGEISNHTWDFGDGETSTDKDPVHTYKNADTFNVQLTVSGKNGTDEESKAGLVTVTEGTDPTAGFDIDKGGGNDDDGVDEDNPGKGNKDRTVKFKDLSSSPDDTIVSVEWDFGDGAASNENEPVHTYIGEEGDTFTVSQTVRNANGFDTVTKPSFVSIASSVIPGFVKGAVTGKKTGDEVEGVECCLATRSGAEIVCVETTKDGLYFIQVASGEYVFKATKDGFSDFSKNIEVTDSETIKVDVKLKTGRSKRKSFTFNCEHEMEGGFFGLETLTMNIGDTENCTLKLTNHEAGKTVEIASLLKKGFRSAIEISPESGVTDENGEIEITITAIQKGKDWAAWAVPNDRGVFKFNKRTYDAGFAWGMFVEIR
ncbi:MAG: PKD domain-containing protein, partial [Candidatus Anammoxibacter sp.]